MKIFCKISFRSGPFSSILFCLIRAGPFFFSCFFSCLCPWVPLCFFSGCFFLYSFLFWSGCYFSPVSSIRLLSWSPVYRVPEFGFGLVGFVFCQAYLFQFDGSGFCTVLVSVLFHFRSCPLFFFFNCCRVCRTTWINWFFFFRFSVPFIFPASLTVLVNFFVGSVSVPVIAVCGWFGSVRFCLSCFFFVWFCRRISSPRTGGWRKTLSGRSTHGRSSFGWSTDSAPTWFSSTPPGLSTLPPGKTLTPSNVS